MNRSAKELNQLVHDMLPQIIDYFTSVYGEDNRQRISSRLNNTIFVFAGENHGKLDQDFTKDTLSFLDESGIILADKTYRNMIKDVSSTESLAGGVFVSCKFDNLTTPYMMCYFPYFDGLDNARFFHELNHIIQTDIYQKDGGFTTRSGLIRTSYSFNPSDKTARMEESEQEKENVYLYEGLNEVFNDYLSLKVVEIAEKNGFYFSEAKNVEASYAAVYPMMDKFIDENFDVIASCMLEGKRKKLISLVGDKNLEKLADSINDLLDFEDKHYAKEVEKLKSYDLNMQTLLTMDRTQVPQELKYYTSLCRDIKDIVDDIEQEIEIGE